MEQRQLRRTLDALATVNVVDREETDIDREQVSHPSEFPAGEIPDNQNDAAEGLYRRPRQAETGQDLNTLTTENEKGKTRQKLTEHGRTPDSYHNENQYEDADLKLGENENDELADPVYEPYSQGNGPLNSRYENPRKDKYEIVLHSSKSAQREDADPNKGPDQLWICVDLDETVLSKPEEYQAEDGTQLFGDPLPGASDALRELVDGGARVSIYTARQYFEDDEEWLKLQVGEELDQLGIPYSDIYIGKKPPAHFFVDDRTIPPFDGDWDLVLDAVRDRLDKKANDPVKDTVDYQGIKMDVEWPAGSIRSYEGQDTYVTHMKADYGYARGVEGNDGEELDIYLADRDSDSPTAFIIEQLKDDGSYDEDKIVLGVTSEGEAADIFLQHMPAYMLGDIREVPVDRLVNALYGEPEDRRGQEDQVPTEEAKDLRLLAFKIIASYSDLAMRAIDQIAGRDTWDSELAQLIFNVVDPSKGYVAMIDALSKELIRTSKDENSLAKRLEAIVGPSKRPQLDFPSYSLEEQEKAVETVGPGGTQKVIQAMIKCGTKTWPEDDIFDNEFTDGTEDRENRDIPRSQETEKIKYRNAEIGGSRS